MKNPELDMVLDCQKFFKDEVGMATVVLEVPFLNRCIDMVMINEKGVIFTVEFKISNIRHAIRQAYDHALGADYAFICMPETTKINMELLKSKNIGLFLYNPFSENKARTAICPTFNKRKVKLFSEMLRKTTMKILKEVE